VGQAVANLIDNAIKYSAHVAEAHNTSSEVNVSVTTLDEGIEISVADRGPGIASADRERVLRRFVRLEKSRTESGTGLGLSLVQAVARLHGGSVRLEDNEPGLRVVLTLPRRLAE
jgi:signal transduction histidine kinase